MSKALCVCLCVIALGITVYIPNSLLTINVLPLEINIETLPPMDSFALPPCIMVVLCLHLLKTTRQCSNFLLSPIKEIFKMSREVPIVFT